MAKSYKYEIYNNEDSLETWLNDPLSKGMKPIAIYRRAYPNSPETDLIVWWEMEDSDES